MRKKIIHLFIVFLLSGSFSACTKKNSNTPTPKPDDICVEHPDDPHCTIISFCQTHPDDPSCLCVTHPENPTCNPLDCAKNPNDPRCTIISFCKTHPDDSSCLCMTHPDDPKCNPIDCTKTPNDPHCTIISFCQTHPDDPSCLCVTHPENPTCNPIDCAKTPNDPRCTIISFCKTHPDDLSCLCVTHPEDPSCQPTPSDCSQNPYAPDCFPPDLISGNDFEKHLKHPKIDCAKDQTSCPAGAYVVADNTELSFVNNALYKQGQSKPEAAWGNNRYAVLIKPSTSYFLSGDATQGFALGFLTQVLGLGKSPDDTQISGMGIQVLNRCDENIPDSGNADTNREECLRIGGLNNFWRGFENVSMLNSSPENTPLRLAISQATPIRRIHLSEKGQTPQKQELVLCDWYGTTHDQCGYTSGGFMANASIPTLTPGSQQQWLLRNAKIQNSQTAVWNFVDLSNNIGQYIFASPQDHYQSPKGSIWAKEWVSGQTGSITTYPLTTVPPKNLIIREKPFLLKMNDQAPWSVARPGIESGRNGYNWQEPGLDKPEMIDDNYLIIAPNPDKGNYANINSNDVSSINAALNAGKRIIFMPGVYHLYDTINVTQADSLILGLGMPSVVCETEKPCIAVIGNAEKGTQIAGMIFDAGYKLTSTMVQIGDPTQSSTKDNSDNPIVLSDIFIRIAEFQYPDKSRSHGIRQTKTGMTIYSNNAIGDNIWIWRGDHDLASGDSPNNADNLVTWNFNRAAHGLVVYGDHVSIYGLAVEHFQDYQTVWYGDDGRVYMYQSEMPYDVPDTKDNPATDPNKSLWICHDPKTGAQKERGVGCASYVIDSTVNSHYATGLGIYTFFYPFPPYSYAHQSQTPPIVKSAIKAPQRKDVVLEHIHGRFLDGTQYSGLLSLVNDYSDTSCWGAPAYCTETKLDAAKMTLCSDVGENDNRSSLLDSFTADSIIGKVKCPSKLSSTRLTKRFKIQR